MDSRNRVLGVRPGFPWKIGNFRWISGPLKCVRLCKQKRPQRHGAADLSAGDSASSESEGFRMDSPVAGVTSAGAMRPYAKILWPLVRAVDTAAVSATLYEK